MKIKIFDTFAGIGGFHLAAQEALGEEKIDCVGFSEINSSAEQTYLKNFPESKNFGDISKLKPEEIPSFDLLMGGIPCQPFSVAGKQLGEQDKRGGPMWDSYIRLLEEKQPKYFIIENVKGLLSSKFSDFLERVFSEISNAGYTFKYKVLNTKEHGLPQNRERVFIVGGLGAGSLDHFEFPEPEKLRFGMNHIVCDFDEKYFLPDEVARVLTFGSIDYPIIEKVGKEKIQKIIVRNATNNGFDQAYLYDGINVSFPKSETRRGRVQPQRSGTLTCNDLDAVLIEHNGRLRIKKFSPLERELLQGFPEEWTEGVSESQRYNQTGNAISVKVVEKIIKNLFTK